MMNDVITPEKTKNLSLFLIFKYSILFTTDVYGIWVQVGKSVTHFKEYKNFKVFKK